LDKNEIAMKDMMKIKEVQNIERLENEYDLQKASLLERKLRLMLDENPDLISIRKKIRSLISEYEAREWSDYKKISESKIEESDKAESIVNFEQKFLKKRKESIHKKLQEFDMTQQDLGILLGHPKSYMSELINGVSQFTMKDFVIIHRIFDIRLKTLIPTYLPSETRDQVRKSIAKLNKPKLRLKKAEAILG
jgi:hypothetical protein